MRIAFPFKWSGCRQARERQTSHELFFVPVLARAFQRCCGRLRIRQIRHLDTGQKINVTFKSPGSRLAFATIANRSGIGLPNSGQLLPRIHLVPHAVRKTFRFGKSHRLVDVDSRLALRFHIEFGNAVGDRYCQRASQECQGFRAERTDDDFQSDQTAPLDVGQSECARCVHRTALAAGPQGIFVRTDLAEPADPDSPNEGCSGHCDQTGPASRRSRSGGRQRPAAL